MQINKLIYTILLILFLVVKIYTQNNSEKQFITVIPTEQYKAGWFHNFWFGKHWRDVWTTPIRVPVIDLSRYELLEEPRFLINLDSIKNKFNINNFSLTGIEVQPYSGNVFILSSHEKAIVELSSNGELLNAVKLKSKNHPQPEGIAFLSDLF